MARVPRFSAFSHPKGRPYSRRRSQIADSIRQKTRFSSRSGSRLISVVAQDGMFTLLCNSNGKSKRKLPAKSPRLARVTLQLLRMSGSSRSPFGSQSPRPRSRCQSTSGRDNDAPAGTRPPGRERLAIDFLAGQQPRPRTASTSGGGGPGAPDFVRQRVASTHVPGASSSRHRSFVATPSALGRGASPTYAIPASPPDARGRTYHLEVEQHPERSAEFGPAVLSRLPLAPPPIVKLIIRDHTGSPINPNTELPFLVAHLALCAENGAPIGVDMPGAPPHQRLLYGTLVSSAQVLRNLRGHVAPYFIFPDVSVRQRGRYTLQITLMRLPRIGGSGSGSYSGDQLASVYTNVFEVVSHTNYMAPQPTQLTQLFIRQGARMYAFESSIYNQPGFD